MKTEPVDKLKPQTTRALAILDYMKTEPVDKLKAVTDRDVPEYTKDDFYAVTYGKFPNIKIAFSESFLQGKRIFAENFSFANRHKNAIIPEMGYNAEIFLRQNFSKELWAYYVDTLKSSFPAFPLKNPYDTFLDVGETRAKRELFAEYFTLFVNDENAPDDLLELMKLL